MLFAAPTHEQVSRSPSRSDRGCIGSRPGATPTKVPRWVWPLHWRSLVDPVTVSTVITAPRERVFDYLQDIANHSEFTDHYLVDWHLTRIDSVGRGAGARFRLKLS